MEIINLFHGEPKEDDERVVIEIDQNKWVPTYKRFIIRMEYWWDGKWQNCSTKKDDGINIDLRKIMIFGWWIVEGVHKVIASAQDIMKAPPKIYPCKTMGDIIASIRYPAWNGFLMACLVDDSVVDLMDIEETRCDGEYGLILKGTCMGETYSAMAIHCRTALIENRKGTIEIKDHKIIFRIDGKIPKNKYAIGIDGVINLA